LLFQARIAEHEKAGKPICYLDESGHALSMPRTHGYSHRGTRCFGTHDWGAKGRVNVIGALIGKLLFAVGLFNCSVDSTVFGTWVKEFLLPGLTEPAAIVMDNASFHKDAAILKLIRDAGHIIEFLPPYSPDLNPIEHKWAEKKAFRRKHHCSVELCYA
jgi:transposase